MTAEIGRVLGGRYRLVAPIGMGASAQVYLADDVKLRRRVALKMLHDALAGDAEFLRRFRAEARAAAALSHPNVMAVYDWGDGDVAFIVTEYLPGGSLRALLDGGQQLSPAQALGVGLEAARALDYAHRRGFVHRDVKPANLLFGEEQRLRIADFGLARALAEAAWTEPQGVLGTARYSSPEQAKGESLSGKADVYALALVLVEAVTGEVPFVADTTLGTLMARVDKPLVVPDSLGPLQAILTRAGHPDPEQRIDARTLAKGLLRAAKELSRPAPLPLAGALASGADLLVDADPTVHGPVDGEGDRADEAPAPNDLTADDLELEPPHWVNQAASAAVPAGFLGLVPDLDPELAEPEPVAEDDPAIDHPAIDDPEAEDDPAPDGPAVEDDLEPVVQGDPAVVVLVDDDPEPEVDDDLDTAEVALVEVASAIPAWSDSPPAVPDAPDRIVVPAVDAAGRADAPPVVPPPALAGDVEPAGQDVDREAPRRRRRWPWVALVLVLVLGAAGGAAAVVANRDEPAPEPLRTIVLPLPTLVGLTEEQATKVADAAGWTVEVERVRRDLTVKGRVLETEPAPGTRLKPGASIAVTVSDGQIEHPLPEGLVGATAEDAVAALVAVDLKGEVAEVVHDEEVVEGVVIKVADGTPPTLETGGIVGLIVSKGPAPRTVPSGLRGSTVAEATAALEAVQLRIATTESFSDDVAKGDIISVLPAQGETVARGTVITVEVSKGPNLVPVPSVSSADNLSEAIAILTGAGFEVGSVESPATGTPRGTSPAAGTMVAPGSTIDILMR